MCLRGVSELHQRWLERDPDAPVSVYVVWAPELGADRDDVMEAAALMPDPRVRHYWDPDRALGAAYGRALVDRAEPPLWDVYFLYRPDATWTGPVPGGLELWMQQLSSLTGVVPRLDPAAFREGARRLYPRATPGGGDDER